MPGFVDSHTHLIFAGDRAEEFALRMAGRPYRPGGILDTVAATRQAAASAAHRPGPAGSSSRPSRLGTTTIEIKTGYGLTAEHEAAHLRIARSLTPEATFLGAHLVPPEFAADRGGYLRLLSETMIPAAAGDGPLVRRLLREGRLRRRRVAGGPGGGAPARHGAAGARQPAGTRAAGSPWPANSVRHPRITAPI